MNAEKVRKVALKMIKDSEAMVGKGVMILTAARAKLAELDEKPELKHGDKVTLGNDSDLPRIILYGQSGKLEAFNLHGGVVGWNNLNDDYKPTGETIFDDN